MKLHKIDFLHAAPKDQKTGVEAWVLFDRSEEALRDLIDEKYCYGKWKDRNEDSLTEPIPVYNEDYEPVGTETYYEKVLRLRGDANDEDEDFSDAYYGINLFGWDEGREISDADAETLLRLGVAEDWR